MATGTTPHASPSSTQSANTQYGEYIETRIEKASSHVRLVDVSAALMTSLAALMIYVFILAVFDQWLVRGGLSQGTRMFAWIVMLVGLLAYIGWAVVPYFLRRINPLYAARTIERTDPSLKNSVLNFLMLRHDHRGVPEGMYRGLEYEAAIGVSKVPVEQVVDRTRLIYIGYLLVGITAVLALYTLVSPKNLLPSLGRVLIPLADIDPVTRVNIRNISPGDSEAILQQQVEVAATVTGLDEEESVVVIYSTDDRQIVDREIMMRRRGEGDVFVGLLPDSPEGLGQDVTYRLEAGDCISPNYQIKVYVAPSIVVKSLEYVYPSYTGLKSQTVEGLGEVKAIEGTKITLHAKSTMEMASATLVLDGLGLTKRRMKVDRDDPTLARGDFALGMRREGEGLSPVFNRYHLEIRTKSELRNPNPIVYRIETLPDLSPLVELLAPRETTVNCPLDGSVEFEVHAGDPDFELSALRLEARRVAREGRRTREDERGARKNEDGAEELLEVPLLKDQPRPWVGTFLETFRFEPAKYKLQVGDVVQVRAVAVDNKRPQANDAATEYRRVQIVEPEYRPQRDEPNQAEERDEDPFEREPSGDERGERDDAAQRDRQPDGGEASDDEQGSDEQTPGERDPRQDVGDEPRDPLERQEPGEEDSERDAAQEEQGDGSESGEEAESGDEGEETDGTSGEESAEPSNEKAENDAEAFERALEQLQKEQQANGKPDAGEPQEGEPGKEGSESTEQGADEGAEQQDGTGQQDKPQAGGPGEQEEPQLGEKPEGDQQGPDQQGLGADGQPGDAGEETESSESRAGADGENTGQDAGPGEKSEAGDESDAAGAKKSGEQAEEGEQGHPSREEGDSDQPGSRREPGAGDESEGGDESEQSDGREAKGRPEDQGDSSQASSDASDDTEPSDAQQPGEGHQPGQRDSSNDAKEQGDGRGEQPGEGESSDEGDGDQRDEDKRDRSGSEQTPRDGEGSDSRSSAESSEEQGNSSRQQASDTEGDSSGDRAGDGEKGAGNQGGKPGQGAPGSSTASEEGAGQAEQPGDGEAGNGAGDGEAVGEGPGNGQQRDDAEGDSQATRDRPGQQPGEGSSAADGSPSSESSSDARPSDSSDGRGLGGGPNGGGPGTSKKTQDPGADKANLEYAKEQTDLALNYLEDQLDKRAPNQELLDRLGWSKEELHDFVSRWRQMEQNAASDDADAQQDLEDSIRSLGLRRPGTKVRTGRQQQAKTRGLKEENVANPPREILDQFEAFLRGRSRRGKSTGDDD